jgi:hypothetical protein
LHGNNHASLVAIYGNSVLRSSVMETCTSVYFVAGTTLVYAWASVLLVYGKIFPNLVRCLLILERRRASSSVLSLFAAAQESNLSPD